MKIVNYNNDYDGKISGNKNSNEISTPFKKTNIKRLKAK